MRANQSTIRMVLGFLLIWGGSLMAQPSNDDCNNAVNITVLDGTCQSGFNTSGATVDVGTGGCMSGSNNVWFTFTAQGPTGTVTINGANGSRPEVAVLFYDPTNCDLASGLVISCESPNGNYSSVTASPTGMTTGQTYYVMVTNSSGGSAGGFDICIDNPIPIPSAGQDCSTSVPVCSSSPFSGNSAGPGIQEMNIANAGCLGPENNSSWYTFTAQTSGTVEMSIVPQNGTDDYDFAIWGPNSTCPPTTAPVRCNFAAFPRFANCGSNSNATGLQAGETATSAAACDNQAFLAPLNVTAGETYILLVDGFTAASQPFDLTWGGTASLDCNILDGNDLQLTAAPSDRGIQLDWKSTLTHDWYALEVQRRTDGSDWEPLLADAMPSEAAVADGNFLDESPPEGLLNYRVRTFTSDGQIFSSNLVRLAYLREELDIYPNPARDFLRVQLPEASTGYGWELTNAMGQQMAQGSIDGSEFEIQRGKLPPGIYHLKVTSDRGSFVRRILWRE